MTKRLPRKLRQSWARTKLGKLRLTRLILKISGQYGYEPDSPTVRDHLNRIGHWSYNEWEITVTPSYVRSFFDPTSHRNFHADKNNVPTVWTRGDIDGEELLGRVVHANLADKLESCTRITVGPHLTVLYSARDEIIARFFAAGRKMHYSDGFRPLNAHFALKSCFGIDVNVDDIALADLSAGYPDLVIEKVAGEWKWPSHQVA